MKANVPTAAWKSFTDQASCEAYVRHIGALLLVRRTTLHEVKGALLWQLSLNRLSKVFASVSRVICSDAGAAVVVEEFLSEGPECSLLALTDGTYVVQQQQPGSKRAYDDDKGPNTGGMGVYSPVPFVTNEELSQMIAIEQRCVQQLKHHYSGCLYTDLC